jgi:long-subunit fatty acid transport protein
MTSEFRRAVRPRRIASAFVAAALSVLVLAVAAPTARAQAVGQQRIATTTGSFLKIGIGARAAGMGGAFVAVANDPSAIYWNPAGVASMVRREAAISYVQWPADITYNHLAYIAPVKKLGGSVGVQLGVLSTEIEETTEERPFGTGVTFGYADWQAGVTYSSRLTDRLLVGVGAKYVHQDLGAEVGGTSANNILLDLGTIYYLGISSVRIGMTMAHFGADFSPGGKFESPNNGDVREYDGFSPPTTFRFGVAWEPIERENHRLTTTIEFDQPSDNQFDTRAGFEYEWDRRFAVRTGYDVNASELKWSAGAGFYPQFGTIHGTVDYAYTDGGALGAIHRVSLGGRF